MTNAVKIEFKPCAYMVEGKIETTALYARFAPNVIKHRVVIMTVYFDLPSSIFFLAALPSAEFIIIDFPCATLACMMLWWDATLIPFLTEIKLPRDLPIRLLLSLAVYIVRASG